MNSLGKFLSENCIMLSFFSVCFSDDGHILCQEFNISNRTTDKEMEVQSEINVCLFS